MDKNAYLIAAILVGLLIVVGLFFFGTKKEPFTPAPLLVEPRQTGEVRIDIGVSKEGTTAAEEEIDDK